MTQCRHCGRELGTHTLDIGFSLPDEVWALDKDQRGQRAKFNTDVCVLDGNRFFIRGIAFVRILKSDKRFGWGFWAEVSPAVFKRYLELYKVDARGEPVAVGQLANTPAGYPSLEGHSVYIAFGTSRDRPTITLHASTHPLSLEQQSGIAIIRVHEINALLERKKS
jgi:hypothetical protein